MYKRLLPLLLATALIVACTSQPATSPRPPVNDMLRSTVALVDVVGNIYCSGVWINSKEIISAAHCLEGAELGGVALVRQTRQGPTRFAVLERSDEKTDFMLLQVVDPEPHGVAYLSAFTPSVGDELFVVGHPAGIGWTFLRGTVSAFRPWMQVQAPIFEGFSGGGAFNQNGELVGLCHRKSAVVPELGGFSTLTDLRGFLK